MDRIEQLLELLRESPEDSFLRYALALEQSKLGNTEKAIENLELVLKNDSGYLAAYYQLGKFYEAVQRPELAKKIFLKGILLAKERGDLKTMTELRTALDEES